ATRGASIGHVSPEAMEGGPIAVIRDGDMIEIDIPNRSLNVDLTQEEIAGRLSEWRPPEPRIKRGYLARYAKVVGSAAGGAIIQD
ncbi:dihydroxy-acid dehydratase, partial [Desulforudis sp. 1190]